MSYLFATPASLDRDSRRLLLLLGAAFFIGQYDMTLLTLALPDVQASFDIPEERLGQMIAIARLGALPAVFLALLGLLSLSGMLLKNGIVLLDQINSELESGKEPYKAVIDSGVSRVRPVSMAAITTILGLIPLLSDVFFVNMSVTIMAGLGFASLLTLTVVPTLYTVFFRIDKPRPSKAAGAAAAG